MLKEKFSVVIPCYSCSKTIETLYAQIVNFFSSQGCDFEIIFINDQSPQNDWEIICKLAESDKQVKAINFSRNFGQHYAISAGLNYSSGDLVVVMDGDLEDDPKDILTLYEKHKEGFDIVYTKKQSRGIKSLLNKVFSNLYYRVYDYLADSKNEIRTASFILLSKKVVESYNTINETKRQFSPLLKYLGYKTAIVEVPDHDIPQHTTTYTFSKRFEIALTGIIANSTKLLRLCVLIGLIISILSFLAAIFVVSRKIMGLPAGKGWSSIMTSIFFIGGLTLTSIGIVALYVETILQEVKRRPAYIVSDTINL